MPLVGLESWLSKLEAERDQLTARKCSLESQLRELETEKEQLKPGFEAQLAQREEELHSAIRGVPAAFS